MLRGSSLTVEYFICALALMVPTLSAARAADTETRDFNVSVDGKLAAPPR